MTSDPDPMTDRDRERLRLAYLQGYEYGTAYGMTAGYREAMTDLFDFHADLIASRRLRRPSHAELTRRRQAASDKAAPALTAEQIRDRAAASWGFTPDAPPPGSHDISGAVAWSTPRGARRRIHHP